VIKSPPPPTPSNNFGLDGDKLYIADIQAADGIRMKRFEPRGKGSSSPLIKRCSNITLHR
jgi:large subunit ribosomal protein L22